MNHYDLIVVGAGPGGYTAALEAAALKKSVLLIEADKLGGTCLNRGCIPTKALLRASRLYRESKEGAELGVECESVSYDLAAMFRHAASVQNQLRDGIASLMTRGKVEVCEGVGTILDGHTVAVGDMIYEADYVLAAAGSIPAVPPIPGLNLPGVVTSDHLLSGDGVDCKSIIIIGGGVVGVEFAQIYSDLGAEVTIVEALPRLLANLDRELGQSLALSFKKRGISVFTGASVKEVAGEENGLLSVSFINKKDTVSLSAEKVLVCTGRRPNTAKLFAPALAEKLALQRGYVPTDANGRTSEDGLYAIGDLMFGGIQLAHAAEAEARNAVSVMFDQPLAKDASLIPSCIFTEPEIACVGLSADEAKEKGLAVTVKKKLSTSNGKALIDGADRGFVKLISHAEDDVLIGAQLLCPHASEMIGGLTAAIRANLTLSQIEETVFPHPTVSEVIGY